jgi:hypothetical protein
LTWHNISREIGNNVFAIKQGIERKYIYLQDGHYDFKSFIKQFSTKMKIAGFYPKGISFELDETTGKINMTLKKLQDNQYQFYVRDFNKDLLGFNRRKICQEIVMRKSPLVINQLILSHLIIFIFIVI